MGVVFIVVSEACWHISFICELDNLCVIIPFLFHHAAVLMVVTEAMAVLSWATGYIWIKDSAVKWEELWRHRWS